MKKTIINLSILAILFIAFTSCDSGRSGFSYERKADNTIGDKVPGVEITFTSEDSSVSKSVVTDENSYYKILLDPGRYHVLASHPDYQTYSNEPGFSVVKAGKVGTLNIFLKKGGFQGVSYIRNPDGSIGDKISDVNIIFTSEDGSITKSVTTGAGGQYKIVLDPVRYVVTASHPGYEPYSSAPGFWVVNEGEFNTGNIFLTAK